MNAGIVRHQEIRLRASSQRGKILDLQGHGGRTETARIDFVILIFFDRTFETVRFGLRGKQNVSLIVGGDIGYELAAQRLQKLGTSARSTTPNRGS